MTYTTKHAEVRMREYFGQTLSASQWRAIVGADLEPVGLDGADGDALGCLVKQVGIGRARRKTERGLLADALLRGISANLMMFREHADDRPRDEPSTPIEHDDGQGEPEQPVDAEVPDGPDDDIPPQFMLL